MPCTEQPAAGDGDRDVERDGPLAHAMTAVAQRGTVTTPCRRTMASSLRGVGACGRTLAMFAAAFVLASCGTRSPAPPSTTPAPSASPSPAPSRDASPLPSAGRARSWDDFKVMAAKRLVQANPGKTYLGIPPEPLLAIPVLEVELNGNGTVRRVSVMRQPTQALDTVQLAIDAVHRAAPYGDVSHLPRPWRFTEVFLFDDNRRFKPRTLE